ncbi:hypothetical protein ISS30_05250 [bacterium]|nr:hypothetical protein [FCB group bacterium]MBL7191082.1 hypothetical protein [bacterium]
MIKVKKAKISKICQGDIIRDFEYPEFKIKRNGLLDISKFKFPLIIVLTQDCDLEQDHISRREDKKNQDKYLISVLVAPIYNYEHFLLGQHLSETGFTSGPFSSSKTKKKMLKDNQIPRYHYLEFPENIELVPGIIDFKHYFSVNIKYLEDNKKKHFVCKVSELFREDVSNRFANFLSRIGLPKVIKKEK